MLRTRTSLFGSSITAATKDGPSSMLMTTSQSQRRASLTKISACMFRENSTLLPHYQVADMSVCPVEIWSFKQPTESSTKDGSSTKQVRPSRVPKAKNLGTFKEPEDLKTCKHGEQTVAGGKSSDTRRVTSSTSKTTEYLMSLVAKTTKARM